MSDFQPPAPSYRAQLASVWGWWKSIAAKPQLWGVYLVYAGLLLVYPNPSDLFLGELARPIGIVGVIVSTLMVRRNWPEEQTDRGQLTIPDMVYFGAGLVVLAGLAPAIYRLLNDQAGTLSTGSAYLLQMVVPGILITMLIIFFAIAVGGEG